MLSNVRMPSNMRLCRFILALVIFLILKAAFIGHVEVSPDMSMPREIWEQWVNAGMP